MIKPVVQDPDPTLHKEAEPILNIKTARLSALIADMKATLVKEDGLGLAAPQIGISKSIFVIPQEYAPEVRTLWAPLSFFKPLHPTVFINPHLSHYSAEEEKLQEGCLSVSGVFKKTTRAYEVTLRARDERGRRFKIKASGLLARIFQHETDHLRGVLFFERIVGHT
jgi:peptide deformylase